MSSHQKLILEILIQFSFSSIRKTFDSNREAFFPNIKVCFKELRGNLWKECYDLKQTFFWKCKLETCWKLLRWNIGFLALQTVVRVLCENNEDMWPVFTVNSLCLSKKLFKKIGQLKCLKHLVKNVHVGLKHYRLFCMSGMSRYSFFALG